MVSPSFQASGLVLATRSSSIHRVANPLRQVRRAVHDQVPHQPPEIDRWTLEIRLVREKRVGNFISQVGSSLINQKSSQLKGEVFTEQLKNGGTVGVMVWIEKIVQVSLVLRSVRAESRSNHTLLAE